MGLKENLDRIVQQIRETCDRVGRNPDEITLVAVTKTQPVERVQEALALGITHFGENRVQEAAAKIPRVQGPAIWHLVGNLQTNKVKKALELFQIIESVDTPHLALELEKRCARANRTLPVLIEVNTSGEPTKHGVRPEELLQLIKQVLELPHLKLEGLMTIGPGWAVTDPEASRPAFQLLARLRAAAQERFGIHLPHLSMGMSSDFRVGIETGATIIRIGTALFGPRN